MSGENKVNISIKEEIKQKIKEKIKKELLEEIYNELKLEAELEEEITFELIDIKPLGHAENIKEKLEPIPMVPIKTIASGDKISEKKIVITVKAILKIASHALKYAHANIPRDEWVEVIGLLAGKYDNVNGILHIEDAYPMGHGTAVYAEINMERNRKSGHERAYEEIIKKGLFICGWYHSHPSYGCFMSREDLGTQARYQKLWDKAVALVIDPYLINGVSLGFEIYRANFKKRKWFSVPFDIKGGLDISMLPEILDFMNPIIEGKAAYLEYDEE